MNKRILFLAGLLLLSPAPLLTAGGSHGHAGEPGHEQEAEKGPHGGRLLRDGQLSLEITIYEQGVPAEMRVYPYLDDRPLAAADVELSVALERLGGEQQTLRFTAEQDYLLGDLQVAEPHSFNVEVRASHSGRSSQWEYESHEGRTTISPRMQSAAELTTAVAGPRELVLRDTLFGVIAPVAQQVYRMDAPYPGLVQGLHVAPGDQVQRGQLLATLRNTRTLQEYALHSPAAGEVTQVWLNAGQSSEDGPVLEITDLSQVWVELSAFPENIEKLAVGLPVTVYDLHHHEQQRSSISYIAPQMTGGHIARARAVIDNSEGHWRPGMHLKADVEVARREVPLAVRSEAIQRWRGMPVVFARYGDVFEVRPLRLGADDGEYVEVLEGLLPGTEYASGNSFLVKADILKSGASHDH